MYYRGGGNPNNTLNFNTLDGFGGGPPPSIHFNALLYEICLTARCKYWQLEEKKHKKNVKDQAQLVIGVKRKELFVLFLNMWFLNPKMKIVFVTNFQNRMLFKP